MLQCIRSSGSLEEARRMLEEARVFASRLGLGRYGALLASMVGALMHLIIAWRKGDTRATAECVEAAAETWRRDRKTLSWAALLLPAIVVEYALASRAQARAALAAARAEAADRDRQRRPPGLGSRIAGFFGLRPRPRPPSIPRGAVFPLDSSGPGPGSGSRPAAAADAEAEDLEGLALASKNADRFADEVVAMIEEERRRRLPTLAPFVELARAERLGLAPNRRLRHLRAARDAFARFGMRPFEALAWLRLSRAEPRPAAASEAAAAAQRIAEETGVFIPALGRAASASSPVPGEYITMWV
eukprot:tig00000523_g1852.t1